MARNQNNEGGGPTQRQLKVGELLRRALADVLMRGDIHDPELAHVSVTVGEVRATPDLRNALVFVLPLGGLNGDNVVEALNRNKSEIRRSVNKLIALKYSPDLKFTLDRTFDQLDESRRLFSLKNVQNDIVSGEDE